MTRNRIRTIALVVGCVTAGALLTPVAQATAATILHVFVTNDPAHPVPVAGSVTVANLPATQAVSGSVTVANLPATQAVSGTVTVGSLPAPAPILTQQVFAGFIDANQGNGAATHIDVGAYKTIRLSVDSDSTCTPQDPAHVTIFDGPNGTNFDQFDFYYPGGEVHKVYDTPGTSLEISVLGPIGCGGKFVVWGRSN